MKENISLYSLDDSSSGNSLIIISDGSLGCRIFQDTPEQITLIANNLWDYPDLLWGNYMKMIKVRENVNYEVVIQFIQN